MIRDLFHSCATALIGTVVLVLASGCSSSGTYSLAEVERNPAYAEEPLDDLMVMALYPDEELEVRVVVENAFSQQLQNEGVEVVPGFRHVQSYEGIETRTDEVAAKLQELQIDGLILFDPIRAKHYDPSEYENRRGFYRAMGMKTSTMFAAIGQLAAEADASKFVIEIALWNVEVRDLAWHGTWNIKAPNGYDLDHAKTYSAEFASIVVETLRAEGLVN
ncbi:MAG: hypothetical protein ACYTEQ_20365 [Planctomycetota bacterium]